MCVFTLWEGMVPGTLLFRCTGTLVLSPLVDCIIPCPFPLLLSLPPIVHVQVFKRTLTIQQQQHPDQHPLASRPFLFLFFPSCLSFLSFLSFVPPSFLSFPRLRLLFPLSSFNFPPFFSSLRLLLSSFHSTRFEPPSHSFFSSSLLNGRI